MLPIAGTRKVEQVQGGSGTRWIGITSNTQVEVKRVARWMADRKQYAGWDEQVA
jgi:hypothetical protein